MESLTKRTYSLIKYKRRATNNTKKKMKPQKRKNNSPDEEPVSRKPKQSPTGEDRTKNGDRPAADNAVGSGGSVEAKAAVVDNLFDRINVKDADIGAIVESLNSDNNYMLHISSCPVVPRPSGKDTGPVQRSVVVAIRFQKMSNEVDCWCMKPSHLIDTIRAVRQLMPQIGLGDFIDSLREYALREVPQGPSVPRTRSTRNGGRFETRVVAGFVPLGPNSSYKNVVDGIGTTLSDFFRSKLFGKIFLGIVKESTKDSNSTEPGRQGIYGIIKDPSYFLWDVLQSHRLKMSYDVPLDTTFMNPTISEMLSRMFPDDEYLALPEVRFIGYKRKDKDDSEDEVKMMKWHP